MPPKKPAAEKTVPTSPVGSESNENDTETAESDAVGSVSTSKVTAHPPAMVMVKNAVKELDSRKGVSSQAIRNSIKVKYPTMELVRLKYMVRKALIKGLENGTLVRPANSTAAATGAQGRFRLAPKTSTEPKQKTENTDPNVEKPKATKAGSKKANGADKESGTVKKKDSKKKSETTETVKKTKKANDATASKVAPAKRPKAKRGAINMEASEEVSDEEPKAKGPKAAKEPKSKVAKAAKEPKSKVAKAAKEPKAKVPKEAKVPKAAKEKASVKDDKPVGDQPKARATTAAGRRVKMTK